MKNLTKLKLFLHSVLPPVVFGAIYKTWAIHGTRRDSRIAARMLAEQSRNPEVITFSRGNISFPILLNPKNGALDTGVLRDRRYEQNVANVMARLARQGDAVIDVGANIGIHSLYFSRLVGASGSVRAFEPVTALRSQFQESIRLAAVTNVDVYPFAMGAAHATGTLHVDKTNAGHTSFVPIEDPATREIAEIRTPDSFDFSGITLIKVDVEGFEEAVIRGALRTLRKSRPSLILEFSPMLYTASQEDGRSLLDLLASLDYTLSDIEDDQKELSSFDGFLATFGPSLRGQTNLLCTPKFCRMEGVREVPNSAIRQGG